jgi:hypothetical protein
MLGESPHKLLYVTDMIFRHRSTDRRNIVMKLYKTINRASLTAGVSEPRRGVL